MPRWIVVGTRGSALAQWQANHIIARLKDLEPDLHSEIRIIRTEGDKDQVHPLADIGGLGVFTKAIDEALLSHEIDLAVHSLKDLPTELADGLVIAAIPGREDARDCLVSRLGIGLFQLASGSRIGTSSARRAAQIRALRPDINVIPLRGNVDTRLRKAHSEDYDAIVLAAAGITRLGRASEITEYFDLAQVLPDPGQGALAVEIRADDKELARLVSPLDHPATHAAVAAERAYLRALGGGCRMPIGTFGRLDGSALVLQGIAASQDGRQLVRAHVEGPASDPIGVGTRLAVQILCDGGSELLNAYPLRGERILVTRAREQAQLLSTKIRALGGVPVEFPAIGFQPLEDFAPLDRALQAAREFDWIIFTSANGVHAVADRLQSLKLAPSVLQSAKLGAIGPATAKALQALNLNVDFVPTKFLGDQIAIELPIRAGESALLLRADIASDALALGLSQRGVRVNDVDAYHTVKPPSSNLPDRIDAVTFTSSSTVQNLIEMLHGRHNLVDNAAIFCIGPVTAETARGLGLHINAAATEHTIDGLLAAMVEYYQARHTA